MATKRKKGNQIIPWRFMLFFALLAVGGLIAIPTLGWSKGALAAFDAAALTFLATCFPAFGFDSKKLRDVAERNDANRAVLLVVSVLLTMVILAVMTGELTQKESLGTPDKLLIVLTLLTVWSFANAVYTWHYTHLFYSRDDKGKDAAGLIFPGTKEPLFSDFAYFAFTLGVAVQTSDVQITSPFIRKVVTAHCVAGFFFNLGVLALTLNVLGSN